MDKRKIYGTILGGIAFIAVIIAVTYARYVWRSTDTDLSFSINDSYFYCDSGIENNVSSLSPVLDYRSTSGVESFLVKNVGRSDTTFSISLNISSIDSSLKDESFKYKIMLDSSGGNKNCASTSESGCTTIAEGNFANAVVGMNTFAETVTLPNNSKYEYYLFLYIDGNMENSEAMQSSSMVYTLDVCEVVVFFDYNGGSGNKNFLKVTDIYSGLPTATKGNTVINFESNGGSSASSQTVSHTFGGWYKEAALTTKVNEGASVTSTTNHTLHAKWNMTDLSGSSTTDGCITLPTPTKTGYSFGGWYKDSGLTTVAGAGGASYCVSRDANAGDVTLYAKWNANTYYLNYTMNGGTKGTGSPSSTKYGSNVTIGNPTKNFTIAGNVNSTGATIGSAVVGNYTFAGWTAANLNTSTALYGTTLSNITTSWSNGSTKVKGPYFKNLTSTNGATVTMTANWNDLTLTLPTVTKSGSVCNWNTKADGTGDTYLSGGSYTVAANTTEVLLTLYAQCTN